MYYLGDEIIYKKIKGVIVDVDNQIIYDDEDFYKVEFKDSIFIESLFEEDDDLDIYLSLIEKIKNNIIDIRS